MDRMLIDSGPLIALFDCDDLNHSWAIDTLRENSCELVTTIATIHEVLTALSFEKRAQIDFLEWVEQGAVTVAAITENDITRLWELTKRYPEHPVDLADASLVLLAEKLGIDAVITVGRGVKK
jgi:predicted nucleic acid-binding protein